MKSFAMINKKEMDRILIYHKDYSTSFFKSIFEFVALSSFNNVFFSHFEKIFTFDFSTWVVKTLLKGIKYSIKKLYIISLNLEDSNDYSKMLANCYFKLISEYKHDNLTHILYKFLVKSSLIEPINEIELELLNNFTMNYYLI